MGAAKNIYFTCLNNMSSVAKLNKFEDEDVLRDLINIVIEWSKDVGNDGLDDVSEFAKARGISNVGALKTLVSDLRKIPSSAVKKNVSSTQFKEDLIADGLHEAQATIFAQVYESRLPELRTAAIESTLSVNQLVDLQWKFGVTTASSDIQLVGNTFLQMKWTVRDAGGKLETISMELSLPQFYKFLHEMEKAKTSMEMLA